MCALRDYRNFVSGLATVLQLTHESDEGHEGDEVSSF